MKQVGCVVMASGTSSRFGENKLLAPLGGKPLLMHTLEKLPALPLARIVVVSPDPRVQQMAADMGFAAMAPECPDQADTVRTGVRALAGLSGGLFCVGDQPLCRATSLLRLIQAFEAEPDKICRLCSGEQPGNPVLFPAALFGELETLPAGKGGSQVARQHPKRLRRVQAEDPRELEDVDTPEALARLEQWLLENPESLLL